MPAEIVASQPPSREPAGSDRLPVHRSESPTGYSSAGCSPAEPASASPVTDIVAQSRSSAAIKMRCSTPLRRYSPSRAPRARRERECHLYFARRVTFLSCADIGTCFLARTFSSKESLSEASPAEWESQCTGPAHARSALQGGGIGMEGVADRCRR